MRLPRGCIPVFLIKFLFSGETLKSSLPCTPLCLPLLAPRGWPHHPPLLPVADPSGGPVLRHGALHSLTPLPRPRLSIFPFSCLSFADPSFS